MSKKCTLKLPSAGYYLRVYKRFGFSAVLFLVGSKLKRNKTGNLKIRGAEYPITLSNFSYDVTTLFQIFFAKEYEISFAKAPAYIIDCGANIGLSAVYFANKFPQAVILAIEPDENNFRILQRNIVPYKNIIALKKAVWHHIAVMETVDTGNGGWAVQTKESSDGNGVEGITIQELMSQFNFPQIDLLKIDIEGAEQELFSENYDSWLSITSCIAIELHEFLREGSSENFYKAIEPYHFTFSSNGENLICKRTVD